MFKGFVAPVEITLDSGLKVCFHPITYGDMLEVDNYLRGRMLDAAEKSITPDLPVEVADKRRALAFDRAMSSSVLSANMGGGFLETFEGVVVVAFMSLRHGRPEITHDEVAKIMSDRYAQSALQNLIAGKGPTQEGEDRSDPSTKTRRKSYTRPRSSHS